MSMPLLGGCWTLDDHDQCTAIPGSSSWGFGDEDLSRCLALLGGRAPGLRMSMATGCGYPTRRLGAFGDEEMFVQSSCLALMG